MLAQEFVCLLGNLRSGGFAGADGPDRFVGEGEGIGATLQGGAELSLRPDRRGERDR